MSHEIHRATPGAGRRIAMRFALVTAGGALLVAIAQAYQPALLEWAASDPARTRSRAQLLIAGVAFVLLAPLAGFTLYMWRLGTRTLNEGRFPPERMTVIRDTPVLRGREARGRGQLLRSFAAILFALLVLMAIVLVRLATFAPSA